MIACGSAFLFFWGEGSAMGLLEMVWPPILLGWSVTEDSSLGGGGVGSAGRCFFAVVVFLFLGWSPAPAGRRCHGAPAWVPAGASSMTMQPAGARPRSFAALT